jgi:hypothetical protein
MVSYRGPGAHRRLWFVYVHIHQAKNSHVVTRHDVTFQHTCDVNCLTTLGHNSPCHHDVIHTSHTHVTHNTDCTKCPMGVVTKHIVYKINFTVSVARSEKQTTDSSISWYQHLNSLRARRAHPSSLIRHCDHCHVISHMIAADSKTLDTHLGYLVRHHTEMEFVG